MSGAGSEQPGAFVGGKWQAGEGAAFQSINPATGEVSWSGKAASKAQVEAAIAAARAAYETWSRRPFDERAGILQAYADIVRSRTEEIAGAISADMGKTMKEARQEAGAVAGKIGLALKAYEERTGTHATPTDYGAAEITHRPHGVVAVLGPYNFPAHLPNGHIVPALLAGNACVLKPSELSPAVAGLLADALAEAGMPDGCFNIVHGGGEVGQALLAGDIDAVCFTGSSSTGRKIHAAFGGRTEVRLALEMGGNNPLIVWEPNDVAAAAAVVRDSAFLTSGQRCTCARRLIVKEGVEGDTLLVELEKLIGEIVIGEPDSEETWLGPLVSAKAANDAVAFQDKLLELGGKPLIKLGVREAGPAYVSPGLVDMTNATGKLDEECFGPLLQVWRVSDFDAALQVANDTKYGLAAGLVSERADLWETFRATIRAGVVNWNRMTVGASGALPFGGPGWSGNHAPGGSYAADYCAWPMASLTAERV